LSHEIAERLTAVRERIARAAAPEVA